MYRDSTSEGRYPVDAALALREVRHGHFWFASRLEQILRAVSRLLGDERSARVLEIGCSDGHVLADLSARWNAFGLENMIEDVLLAEHDGLRVVAGDGERAPFRPVFDLIALFDVVEHVSDDAKLMRSAASLARYEGWIVLTCPADPRLWSHLDRYAGHFRRYDRQAISDLFESADVELVSLTPMFRLLWPLARINAFLGRGRKVENPKIAFSVSRPANALLSLGLKIEQWLFGESTLGRGTSWLAVGRTLAKKETSGR